MHTRLDGPVNSGLSYQVNEYMYVICKDPRVDNPAAMFKSLNI